MRLVVKVPAKPARRAASASTLPLVVVASSLACLVWVGHLHDRDVALASSPAPAAESVAGVHAPLAPSAGEALARR